MLTGKSALNEALQAKVESGFYLRCDRKPEGSKQGSNSIRFIFKNPNQNLSYRDWIERGKNGSKREGL